jgi:hypothetical protein
MRVLDVSKHLELEAVAELRASALLSALLHILLSGIGGWKTLQNQKTSKTKCSRETALENSRVHARTIKLRPINLEVSVRVLGQPILIRRASTAQIDRIDLSDV